MAWSFIVKEVTPFAERVDFLFDVKKDGVVVASETLRVQTFVLADAPSDERNVVVNEMIAAACKKYMVVEDTKLDMSSLKDVEVSLSPVVYETKAEKDAKKVEVVVPN